MASLSSLAWLVAWLPQLIRWVSLLLGLEKRCWVVIRLIVLASGLLLILGLLKT